MTTTETQPAATASEFGKIYLEYRSVFIQRACRYVRDEHIASDIVADSFMAFWENRFALPADTNVPAYVYATVRNRCLNHLRNQSLRLRIEQKMHSDQCRLVDADIASLTARDPDKLFEDEIFEILRDTMSKLPARTRQIYLRSRLDDRSYEEIARELGISVSLVDKEISRSLHELRHALKDYVKLAIPLIYYLLRY